MRADNPARPGKLAWAGLALVMPSAMFWLATLLAGILHQDVLARPFTHAMQVLDFWFVIGVLILMPLAGGFCAAISFHRRHLLFSLVVVLLGFGPAALAILMQTAAPPVH
jgi:hypothetical protein